MQRGVGVLSVFALLALCSAVSCSNDAAVSANGSDGGPIDATAAMDASSAADGTTPSVDAQSGTDGSSPGDANTSADGNVTDSNVPVDAGCSIGHLVISQLRTRGAGGAGDELVELFNATASPVVLDATWTLSGRTTVVASYSPRWTGSGKSIPAFGHYLITGAAYTQMPAADDALSAGLGDAISLRLVSGATTVDALCTYYDTTTQNAYDNTFTCEGTPSSNLPHDDTNGAGSNVDVSLERKACTDANNNSSDFASATPAAPRNTLSAPTP